MKVTAWGRALALTAVAVLLAYPVRAFLLTDTIPLSLRLAWLPLVAVAYVLPRVSLLAFVATAPLLPMVAIRRGWPPVSVPEVWLFALLIAAWVEIALGRRAWRAQMPRSAGLLLIVAAVSGIVALYPFHLSHEQFADYLATVQSFVRDEFLTTISQRVAYFPIVSWAILAEGLALLWLALDLRARRYEWWAAGIGAASALGATAVAVQGIVQRITKKDLLEFWVEQNPGLVRVNATFTDPNGLGAYLAMMIFVALALAAASRSRAGRALWGGAALAIGACLVFTGSRGSWAGAIAGAAVWMAGRWAIPRIRLGAQQRREVIRGAIVAMLVGSIALSAIVGWATFRNVRDADQRSYTNAFLYTFNLRVPLEERLKGRLQLWAGAVRMVEARPFFGIGLGRYYKLIYGYAPDQDELPRPQENAHNYFLQVAAELGLVGLGVWLALGGAALLAALRAAFRATDPRGAALGLGVAAGMTAYHVASLTGHPLLVREGQFALWPVAAAGFVAAGMWRAPSTVPATAASRRLGWAAAALAVSVVASLPIRAADAVDRIDLTKTPFGLYDPEVSPSGASFSWTTGKTIVYLPSHARVLTIPLRSLSPATQTVSVSLNDRLVDRLALTDHDWRRVRYVLPTLKPSVKYFKIELDITPTWQPDWDDRELGVMMGEYEWTE